MKIVIPKLNLKANNTIDIANDVLESGIIYRSLIDSDFLVWQNLNEGYFLIIDGELEVFSNEEDLISWLSDNDIKSAHAMVPTSLTPTLTIS